MGLKMNVAEDLEIDEDSLQAFGEEQEEVLKERTGEEGGRLREAIELLRGTEVRWCASFCELSLARMNTESKLKFTGIPLLPVLQSLRTLPLSSLVHPLPQKRKN